MQHLETSQWNRNKFFQIRHHHKTHMERSWRKKSDSCLLTFFWDIFTFYICFWNVKLIKYQILKLRWNFSHAGGFHVCFIFILLPSHYMVVLILIWNLRQCDVSMCAHRRSWEDKKLWKCGDTAELIKLKKQKPKNPKVHQRCRLHFFSRRRKIQNFKQKCSVGQNWGLAMKLVNCKACLTV